MIKYKDQEYDVIFNMNVMEAIQEEYGSYDKWCKLIDGEEMNVKALKFAFGAMLNEGIEIYNESHEDKREPFTLRQVGRIITVVGLSEASETMIETIGEATESDEKNESSPTK